MALRADAKEIQLLATRALVVPLDCKEAKALAA